MRQDEVPMVADPWRDLLAAFTDWDMSTMLRIVNCESHGDENVVSPPDYDGLSNYGGLQLHGDPQGTDPAYAVDQAHEKWLARGYEPWRGSASCWNVVQVMP